MKTRALIVSYNTCRDLERCLERLMSTGARPEQIAVADNGSTDGSAVLVRRKFPGVVLLMYPDNRGYAAAMNNLVRITDGEFLLLLNPDVDGDFAELEELCAHFERDSNLAAVAPQLRFRSGIIQPNCRRLPDPWTPWRELWSTLTGRPSHWKMGDFDHRTCRFVEQPMFSCIWVRRRAWERIGPLDACYPLFFNDVDWCARAASSGWRILFDPAVAALHDRGGTTRQYPWRKLWHSHAAFARFIARSNSGRVAIVPATMLLAARLLAGATGLAVRTLLASSR